MHFYLLILTLLVPPSLYINAFHLFVYCVCVRARVFLSGLLLCPWCLEELGM